MLLHDDMKTSTDMSSSFLKQILCLCLIKITKSEFGSNHKWRYIIINSEIFARILFSRIALKDIFVTLKIATRA